MDPKKNPFSPGAGTPPPELAGRGAVIAAAETALARTKSGRHARSLLRRASPAPRRPRRRVGIAVGQRFQVDHEGPSSPRPACARDVAVAAAVGGRGGGGEGRRGRRRERGGRAGRVGAGRGRHPAKGDRRERRRGRAHREPVQGGFEAKGGALGRGEAVDD